jgi:GAF domain-containing protein
VTANHWTEADRIAAVVRTGLVGRSAEAAFEDYVRLAADLLGVPIAAINLVAADRQWSVAKVGVEERSVPREVAFCAHVTEANDGLVVPDARIDARFATNPLVLGPPGIRFYAGIPLLFDGLPVGALCIIDTQPRRTLDEWQTKALEILAAQVSAQMLHRAVRGRTHMSHELMVIEKQLRALNEQLMGHVEDRPPG